MKTRLALLTALTTVALVAAPATAAVPTVEVRPGELSRGADSTVPWMPNARTIVHGDDRIRLDDPGYLLGTSGDDYVVAAYPRLLRVHSDGSTDRITRYGNATDPSLTDDGEHLLITRMRRGYTVIRVLDAVTGDQVAKRRFRGYVSSLDATGRRAVLSRTSPDRIVWWNFVTGATRRITNRPAGVADIGANRLATFTGDPYDGGCTVVTPLNRPHRVLWRSCKQAAIEFSPNGRRVVTMHILADGLGPGEVVARHTRGGKAIARYRSYWFGMITWETNRALLMDAHTERRAALVRCEGADCERASGIRRSSLRG